MNSGYNTYLESAPFGGKFREQEFGNEYELLPEFEVAIPPQFITKERPFNPRDPRSLAEHIEVRDEILKKTNFIKKDSFEFKENYIDNWINIQVMTEDSTPQNDFFKIFFSNGKSRKFNLREVPTTYTPSQRYIRQARLFYRPQYYVKKTDGLIYPYFDGKLMFDFKNTPSLLLWRTKIEVLREIFTLQETIAAFANLIAASAQIHDFSVMMTSIPRNAKYNFKPRNSKVNTGKMEQHSYMTHQRGGRLSKDVGTGRPTASLLNQKYSNKLNYPEVYIKAIREVNAGNGKLDRNGDMRVIIFMKENTGWVNNQPVESLEVIFSDRGWHFYPQQNR